MRRLSAGAQTAAERRARENAAKRLREVVPELENLKIYIEERQKGADEADVAHTRHIVVERAPAIFELGCFDRKCNGNHDLTKRVIRALKAHKETFEGKDDCHGENKEGDCELELIFRVEADYAA
jgi:hypothetical protein